MVQIDRGAICGVVVRAAPLHQVDSAGAASCAAACTARGRRVQLMHSMHGGWRVDHRRSLTDTTVPETELLVSSKHG
jgi:hypothetical protein